MPPKKTHQKPLSCSVTLKSYPPSTGQQCKNIGIVRHSIKSFTYSLRGLDIGSQWVRNPDKINLINFPRKLQSGEWVRGEFTTVIEPGTEQRFYFIVKVSPGDVEYLNLYAEIV